MPQGTKTRKTNTNTTVIKKIKRNEKLFEELLTLRYNLLFEILESTVPSVEYDYTEIEGNKQYLIEEFETRSHLVNRHKTYKSYSIPQLLQILKDDDDSEDLKDTIENLNSDIEEFKSKLVEFNSIKEKIKLNEPNRVKIFEKFVVEFLKLPDKVDENNIDRFRSFLVKYFMNPNNWLEDEININNRIKLNPLWLLEKSKDSGINFYSILDKYDELYSLLKLTPKKNLYSDTIELNKKKDVILELGTISTEIIQTFFTPTDFDTLYNTDVIDDLTYKSFFERDLFKFEIGTKQNMLDYYSKPKNQLSLTESHNIKFSIKNAEKPQVIADYFGRGKFGKKLKEEFLKNYQKEFRKKDKKGKLVKDTDGKVIMDESINSSVEHRLYLFFKKVINSMEYKPNPTSKPEHEIEIRSYLQQLGFIGPRPNMDDDTKKKWYADQTLEVGEFVEQPNGSTSHPDLWVQLSNLRLSIEAKSNQGYYPMYGKTPPPKETVYIFSSKKKKYPNRPFVKDTGRTTITFGHMLLTDNIRDIMTKSKTEVKVSGKKLDRTINKTGENFSTVGLTSDVNIQHIGNQSNYWKDNRNIIREKQVLFYNWLEPERQCDTKIKQYTCKTIPLITLRGGEVSTMDDVENVVFKCIGNTRPDYGCLCGTHDEDFEQKDSFVDSTFSDLEKESYVQSFYYKRSKSTKYICHMCLMKYYTKVEYNYNFIDEIVGVLVINDEIYYKINWRNYKIDTWESYKQIEANKRFDNTALYKDFWSNITFYYKDLSIPHFSGAKTGIDTKEDIYVNSKLILKLDENGYILKDKKSEVDMFTIPKIVTEIQKYNLYIYNLYKP